MRTRPTVVFPVEAADLGLLRSLTFELRGQQRQDALARTEKMYCVPQFGPRWPAVAGPLERGVRRRAPNEATEEHGVQVVPRNMNVTTRSARINPALAVERQ